MNYANRVKPGFRGQVHALYQLVADPFKGVQAKTDAIAANFFRQLDKARRRQAFRALSEPRISKGLTKAFYGEQASPEAVEAAQGLSDAGPWSSGSSVQG